MAKNNRFKKLQKWLRQNVVSLIFIFLGLVASLIIAKPINTLETSTYDVHEVPDCEKSETESTKFECWTQRYKALISTESIKSAFDDIKVAYQSSAYVREQCHQITHVMGRIAMDLEDSLGSVYEKGDSFCASGYYHGVVEEIAKKMGRDKFISEVDSICASIISKNPYSINHHNCTHGMGHGLMLITENDLFASMDACKSIVDAWSESSCLGGVFMENINADPEINPTHATSHLRPNEPMYPCTAVEVEYKEPCYLIQTAYALRQTNQDFAKVFELCATADIDFADTCWESLGRDASGNTVQNITEAHRICALGKSESQRSHCSIGASKGFVYHYAGVTEAIQFCNLFSESTVRSTCIYAANDYFRMF